MRNADTETNKESLVETLTYERAGFAAILSRRLAGWRIGREQSAEMNVVSDAPRKQRVIKIPERALCGKKNNRKARAFGAPIQKAKRAIRTRTLIGASSSCALAN